VQVALNQPAFLIDATGIAESAIASFISITPFPLLRKSGVKVARLLYRNSTGFIQECP
jgi:hypothetical protein